MPAESGPDAGRSPSAIVALGRTLGLRIVAEGIEEPASSSSSASWAASSARASCSPGRCRARTIGRAGLAGRRRARAGGDRAALGRPSALTDAEAGLMFILYAVVIGLVIGLLAGGRLAGLAAHPDPLAGRLIVGGLVIQVVLFSRPGRDRVGDLGPWIYVASTVLVVAAVLRNWAIPGMPVVAAGAACNLAAIVANGGYMPAEPGRHRGAGQGRPGDRSTRTARSSPDPALWLLTDIFALPRWLPFANVFSIGDVLIARRDRARDRPRDAVGAGPARGRAVGAGR